jgi:uncharacterized protein (DUF2267 family)
MFHDREDAAHKLASAMRARTPPQSTDPGNSRGGVVTGAVLAAFTYYEGCHPGGKPPAERKKSEYLAHVKAEFADESFETETVVRAVSNVLAMHGAPGEVERVEQSLPEDIRSLWI